MRSHWPTAISTEPPCTQLTPSSANEHVENADTRGAEIAQNEPLPIDPLENNYQHPAAAFVFALKPRSDAPAGEPADDTRLQAKRFQERPMQFRRRRCRRSGTLAFSSRYLSGAAPTVQVTRSSGAE